jgi:methylated-DNA-[protein]-cysteine S-methyltransferase
MEQKSGESAGAAEVFERFTFSPLGWIRVRSSDSAILEIHFLQEKESKPMPGRDDSNGPTVLRTCLSELDSYFSGDLKQFTVAISPEGTPFQTKVWMALQQIPYGHSITYQTLARRLGDLKSIRAAAAANGKNPLAILIPCHRVIGSDGSLTGYAGGLWRKAKLLELEHQTAGTAPTLF